MRAAPTVGIESRSVVCDRGRSDASVRTCRARSDRCRDERRLRRRVSLSTGAAAAVRLAQPPHPRPNCQRPRCRTLVRLTPTAVISSTVARTVPRWPRSRRKDEVGQSCAGVPVSARHCVGASQALSRLCGDRGWPRRRSAPMRATSRWHQMTEIVHTKWRRLDRMRTLVLVDVNTEFDFGLELIRAGLAVHAVADRMQTTSVGDDAHPIQTASIHARLARTTCAGRRRVMPICWWAG